MSSNADGILRNTISGIFQNHQEAFKPKQPIRTKSGASLQKSELELALTVLLVDLASADQSFDPQEYHVITDGLRRVFGTTKSEVQALINQATTVLSNLRGVSRFATLLKDNLDHEQKQAIMEIIEQVIQADGVEDGFETYLRHKLAGMLGMGAPAPNQPDSQ